MHLNLSQTEVMRKHFVSTFREEKLYAFCSCQLHLAELGILHLVTVGSSVQVFHLDSFGCFGEGMCGSTEEERDY